MDEMRTPEEVIGKTLEEILREDMKGGVPPAVRGLLMASGLLRVEPVSVFVLGEPGDTVGKQYAEEFSLRIILMKHPELRQAKVLLYNDYFGEDVFRVKIGGEKDGQ